MTPNQKAAVKHQSPVPEPEDFQGIFQEHGQVKKDVGQAGTDQAGDDTVKKKIHQLLGRQVLLPGLTEDEPEGGQQGQCGKKTIGINGNGAQFQKNRMHCYTGTFLTMI